MKNKLKPTTRLLMGYSLDPGFSTRLDTFGINHSIYKIPWEDKLMPGPIGEYLEVVDFDPASNCYYAPVDLNDISILAENGLKPSEGNPQFHQQFVYAVMMNTINTFEKALGRKIIWHRLFNSGNWEDKYIDRLRVYPHAFRDANAFYDPEKQAVLFGYFEAAGKVNGSNFPNGLVFTCLSPDIIAHETTHALLHSIHPRFMEDTNPDVAAFHEGFADIVSLLNRFSITEILEHELAQTSGRLDIFNLMGELATQFGEALSAHRGALRSAIGGYNKKGEWQRQMPDPNDYRRMTEAHDRGALLVATVFDAFIKLYNHKTQDLLRIASNGTGILPNGRISTDLIKRLSSEASVIAQHLLKVCIRALDFCPPIDITFGDYLRALITADVQISPEDELGYRVAFIEAFRARGIFPEGLNTLSVESLLWDKPQLSPNSEMALLFMGQQIKKEVSLLADLRDRRKIFQKSQELQEKFHIMLQGKLDVKFTNNDDREKFLNNLGMAINLNGFDYDSKPVNFKKGELKIEVHKIRPTFKPSSDGRIIQQVIITLTQSTGIVGDEFEGIIYRGGSTIILDLDEELKVEYIIHKSINSKERFKKQMDYLTSATGEQDASLSMYKDDCSRQFNLKLSRIHSNH